jgi:hypothetical protein
MLEGMNTALTTSRQFLQGTLPYPDLLRRRRVRRKARKLVTCKHWPGDDATGMEAAQLALLRLLWLQRLTRNAVVERRAEDAALLARTALESCIVGLYCAYSGDSLAHMSAANYRVTGRAVSYLSDGDLGSRTAIDNAVEALGELGPDLNIRDLALWLEREQELGIATRLYYEYYIPLSHLFTRSYAFALMRHVQPDGTLTERPAYPWVSISAARLADGCTGLLAANVADKSGVSPEPFLRYATAHLDRLVTPALAFTVKGALRSVRRHEALSTLRALGNAQRRTDRSFRADVPAWQETRISEGRSGFFDPLSAEMPSDLYEQADYDWTRVELDQPPPEIQHPRRGRRARAGSRRHVAD